MLKGIAVCLLSLGWLPLAPPLAAQNQSVQETRYYNFPSNRSDSGPIGPLTVDGAGNVYGAAYIWEYAYIFQLQPSGTFGYTETTIYNFHTSTVLPDATSSGELVVQGPGQLLGTTVDQGQFGCGTLFSLTAPTSGDGSWTAEILYSFQCVAHGYGPDPSSLVLLGGNLYAITYHGGDFGQGSLIELASASGGGLPWTMETVYSFTGGADGGEPNTIIASQSGLLYGTTSNGGANSPYGGTVFQLSPPAQPGDHWTESVLFNFPLPGAQSSPAYGTLGLDQQGNVYGAANPYSPIEQLYPTIFELSPPSSPGGLWTETTIATVGSAENALADVTSGVFVARGGDVYGSARRPRYNYTDSYVYQLVPPASPGGVWHENICFETAGPVLMALTTLGPDQNSLYGAGSYYYFGQPGSVFMLSQ